MKLVKYLDKYYRIKKKARSSWCDKCCFYKDCPGQLSTICTQGTGNYYFKKVKVKVVHEL